MEKPELKASTEKIAPNFMRLFIKQKIPYIIPSGMLWEGTGIAVNFVVIC